MKLKLKSLLFSCCREASVPIAAAAAAAANDHHLHASPNTKTIPTASESIHQSDFTSTVTENLSVNPLMVSSNLHAFTLAEIRQMTKNLSTNSFIGEGGFGPVHKGFIDESLRPGKLEIQTVAVKLLDLNGPQGHREWLTEVIFLGQLRHRHVVKLIGYCCEEEHRMLVYEYMPKGCLDNLLFTKYSAPLPWSIRMKIALGAAKGLCFLHESEKPVIYRDFKTSNILLESDYTAKISDFGLAKDGPEGEETHVSTRVIGTKGYAAPEYLMTGHLTSKSDVYSFGVVLLELITGQRSLDKTRKRKEQTLVEYARPMLKDPLKLGRIIDPRLEGVYSEKGVRKAGALAYLCLSYRPKERPSMKQVVTVLESVAAYSDVGNEAFVYTFEPEPDKSRSHGQRNRRGRGASDSSTSVHSDRNQSQ